MYSIPFYLPSDGKCSDTKGLVTVYRRVDVLRAICPLPAADDDFDSKNWPDYFSIDDYYDLGCDLNCMDYLVLVVTLVQRRYNLLTHLPGNGFRKGLWTTGRATSFAGCFGGRIFPRMRIPAFLLVYSVYVQHLEGGRDLADSRKQMTSRSDSLSSI